jgi:hypothetical protein
MKDAAVPALRDVLHHSKKKSSQRMNAIGATLSRKLIKKKEQTLHDVLRGRRS